MSDEPDQPRPIDLAARVAEREASDVRGKALVNELWRAVLWADPATLPPAVRDARARLLEEGERIGGTGR